MEACLRVPSCAGRVRLGTSKTCVTTQQAKGQIEAFPLSTGRIVDSKADVPKAPRHALIPSGINDRSPPPAAGSNLHKYTGQMNKMRRCKAIPHCINDITVFMRLYKLHKAESLL